MGASGQLVARNVPTDAYGNDRLELDGPAVDGITLEATGGGVAVTLHATEQLTESTVATGMRLAALHGNGGVVRTATAPAALVAGDPYAARITLTSLEWNALTDPTATSTSGLAAQSLSVAATSTLRARGWSADVPFMPAPDWARASLPIFATADLPLEARESLASLATWLATNPTGSDATRSLYQVDTLALLAQPSLDAATPITTLVTARFQAQPFADPFTGKNYGRERWYDPERGSWLTPDPLMYRDSSNLYAFGGGDPVNRRDPTGMDDGDNDAKEDPTLAPYYAAAEKNKRPSKAALAGRRAAAKNIAKGLALSAVPGEQEAALAMRALRVYRAGKRGGISGAVKQAFDEWVSVLPFRDSAKESQAASDAAAAHDDFAEDYHRTNLAVTAAGDAGFVIGAVELLRGIVAPKPAKPPMRANLLNNANPRFGPNDVVYGVYSAPSPRGGFYNPTEVLSFNAGGKIVGAVDPAMAYEISVQRMEDALAKGGRVRFDLTYVNTEQALGGYGDFGSSITSRELRYLQENWTRFEGHANFYNKYREVPTPW
jgi:RHS repeat-associated protein